MNRVGDEHPAGCDCIDCKGGGPRDTLHGVPLPPPPRLLTEPFELQQTIADAFIPIRSIWDKRSEDMLAVLAQSSESSVRVREAVRTMRLCCWCAVVGVLLVGFTLWQVLEHDRAENRRARELDRQMLTDELGASIRRACRR